MTSATERERQRRAQLARDLGVMIGVIFDRIAADEKAAAAAVTKADADRAAAADAEEKAALDAGKEGDA